MNLKDILCIGLGLLCGLPAFTQAWKITNAPPAGRYDDIYFHNADTGWAVTGNGKILKTIDSGDSWSILYNHPSTYLRSVDFLNADIGFAGSLDSVLLRTTDGGATWTEIQDSLPVAIPGICGLSHAGDHVFGVGIFAYPAYFIKSTDQGKTWTHTDLSAYANGLVECHFIDSLLGFVSGIREGSGGIILKTTDGGDTWDEVLHTQNGAEYIWKLDFVSDQIAYGSVESFTGDSIHIVKTVDGGDNWDILLVDNHYRDLQGIGFINPDTGWVVPRSVHAYMTTDGGLSWNPSGLFPNINRFFRLNPNLMYASGSTIYKYDNLVSSTAPEESYVASHSFSSVFPNPFYNDLTFSLVIDIRTTARIDLFNASGQLIENIYAGRIDSGKHQFKLDSKHIQNMPPGVCYLVLRSNEGFITKTLIKGDVSK